MDNFVRFRDALNVKPLEISQDVKDFYAGLGTSQAAVQPLRVRIAATHAGKITRNNGFYLPHKMAAGVSSFTDQYAKPIQIHHQDDLDPIGRAVGAAYVDMSRGFRDSVQDSYSNSSFKQLQDFVDGRLSYKDACAFATKFFINDMVVNSDPDYEGLGYIELVADITDPLAIQKIIDGRYLTGSTGATTNKAICSVCKQNWAAEGKCEHRPGKVYDSAKCVLIAGDLTYDEYSFVNKPADRHSRVIEVNVNGIQDFVTMDEQAECSIPEITLVVDRHQHKQSEEDQNMLFKDAMELVRKSEKFDEVKDLEDKVKKFVDEHKDLDEAKLFELLTPQDDKQEEKKEVKDDVKQEDKKEEVKDDTPAVLTADLVQKLIADALVAKEKADEESKKAAEEQKTVVEDAVKKATVELTVERDKLQKNLDVARKEIRYLHSDIENLTNSMADSVEEVRNARVKHIVDLKVLADEKADVEALTVELKDKTNDDLQGMLVDLGSKVDTQKIADTLNSGLSNNPSGTVDDPTLKQDASIGTETKETGEIVVTDELAAQVRFQWLQINKAQGKKAADAFIDDCKTQKILPAEWPEKK